MVEQKEAWGGDPFRYPAKPLETSDFAPGLPPVPEYNLLLDWMRAIGGRAVSLDFWARGNYARRLIHNKLNARRTLLVPVQYVDEIRWAYRRLALLDVPVEFLWQGSISKPQRVVHLHPADPESLWDAGWGYVAATGGEVRMRRRKWGTICGYARLIPEVVADWIVEEAPGAFSRGEVFVTPDELVGLSQADQGMVAGFEGLLEALAVHTGRSEEVLMELQLPALDGMAPAEFERFLLDSGVELERLRVAFRRLVDASPNADLEALVEEVNYEVAELTLADRFHRFRSRVTRLGGVVGACAAAIGAAAGSAGGPVGTITAAAAGGAAAAGLCEAIRQAAERGLDLHRSPFYVLWELGRKKSLRLKRTRVGKHHKQRRSRAPASIDDGYFHWLAPPSAGVGFLFVKEK